MSSLFSNRYIVKYSKSLKSRPYIFFCLSRYFIYILSSSPATPFWAEENEYAGSVIIGIYPICAFCLYMYSKVFSKEL